MTLNRTQPGEQGAALGVYAWFWDLGFSLAGPLLGAAISVWSYPAAFLGAAVGAILSVILTQLTGLTPARQRDLPVPATPDPERVRSG